MVYIVNDCLKIVSSRSGTDNVFSTCIDMSSINDAEQLTGSSRIYSNAKPGIIMEAFSQAGLYYHYGIPKRVLPKKKFGVYAHV